MIQVLYTDTNAIRATIGIDTNDMTDEMITEAKLEFQMLLRLSKILPDHESLFNGDDLGRMGLSLWCQYFGALAIIETAKLAIMQKFQANNDQTSRFTNIDWEQLRQSLLRKLGDLESDLIQPDVAESAKRFSIMGKATNAVDPIIGPQ